MNKTSITNILFFFLLVVGIEHISASSENNLRKRKVTTTATTAQLFNSIFEMFMNEEDDTTNEPKLQIQTQMGGPKWDDDYPFWP